MTRKFRSTRKFDKHIKSLDKTTFKQATKVIQLFIDNPSHPSLRYKKIQSTSNYYEIEVNSSVRIIIKITPESNDQINTFFIVGTHDEVFPPK